MKNTEKQTADLKTIFASRKAKEADKLKPADDTLKAKEAFIERFGKEKLDDWKEQYGNRDLIFLKVDTDMAVLRPPTADDLGDYMTSIGTNGMSKAVAFIVEQLWLDGDYQLIEDEDKFIAVFLQINNILEGKKADYFRF